MFRYLAEDIAFLLIKNKIVDIEKREECVFGVEVLLLNLTNILTALIISLISNTMLHFAAFMLIFVPLRIFTGGCHAKTSERCYLITTAVYALSVFSVKQLPDLYSYIPATITLVVLIVQILLSAPVENKNNPLNSEAQKRNRLISIVLTAFDSLIFVILYLLSNTAATSVMIFIAVDSILMLIGLMKNKSEKKQNGGKST